MVTELNDTLIRKGFLLIICMVVGGLFISPAGAVNAEFSFSDIHGMPGNTFPVGDQLILTGTDDSAVYWNWSVSDGQSNTSRSWTTAAFDTPDAYTITLRTVGSDASHDEHTEVIAIQAPNELVRANFSYTIDYEQDPATIILFDQSETEGESIDAWYWCVDGHPIPDTQLPEFGIDEYDEDSDRLLHVSLLILTAPGNWMDIEEKIIDLSTDPVPPVPLDAEFTTEGGIQEIHAGESIHFIDQTAGSPTSWSWDFGDGESSNLQSPTHFYMTPGIYTVSLTASDATNTDEETKVNYIWVLNEEPEIIASDPVPSSGDFPLAVQFAAYALVGDRSKEESAKLVRSWRWDIYDTYGSGEDFVESTIEQNPEYTFERSGIYTVTVWCELQDGSMGTATVGPVYVGPRPYADFYWDYLTEADSCCYLVKFFDTSVGPIDSWFWDFGDGSTSTEQHPTHRFKEADTIYDVTLTVTDIFGASNTGILQVPTGSGYNKPDPLPEADFTMEPTGGYIPLTVKFTDASINAVSWFWNFGDGVTSTEQNPDHEYTTPGTYTVNLTVENGSKRTDSKTDHVTAGEYRVLAGFTANQDPVNEKKFSFTDTSIGNIVSWSWDFGDGSPVYVGRNPPVHTFPFSNRYYFVTLTVRDGSTGVEDSKTMGVFTGYQ